MRTTKGPLNTVDADGVALAAIQGLLALVKEKDAQLAPKPEQIHTLQADLEQIKQAAPRSPIQRPAAGQANRRPGSPQGQPDQLGHGWHLSGRL